MDFRVLVLGSGAATPTFSRHCSSQVVCINGKRMIVDCGESTQNQLRQYHQKIQSINTIFISHLHGDHFFGMPGLLSTMHLCGRTEPLTVFAPVGTKHALELMFEVSGTELRYELNIVEMDFDEPRVIFKGNRFVVKAFPMHHSIPTYGFLFEETDIYLNLKKDARSMYGLTDADCIRVKMGYDLVMPDGTVIPNSELTLPRRLPRRYAYCCDTAFDPGLVDVLAGVDLLCMESTFDSSFADMAEERCHCTAAQAATIAKQAGVGQLLLTHFSARYRESTPLLAEATAIFPNTVCASDGAMYEVMNRNA